MNSVRRIVWGRLGAQRLSGNRLGLPEDTVSWFGAMQAQDFGAALWAVGQRTEGATLTSVTAAFDTGRILRTHIMRPTWHFVHPKDIRWMLALTSPRVRQFNGSYYRRSGLDRTVFEKSASIIRHALGDGKRKTRFELERELAAGGIPTGWMGLSYTLMQAELDGIICSGPRVGKQFTYMLLDDRVPHDREWTRAEALGELAIRYFRSHGPATLADFSWWSGLTMTDCRQGADATGLVHSDTDGIRYFSVPDSPEGDTEDASLLPAFDEYIVAYRDRSAVVAPERGISGGMISGTVIVGGTVKGTWKRTVRKTSVTVNVSSFEVPSESEKASFGEAARAYGAFLGLPAVVAD